MDSSTYNDETTHTGEIVFSEMAFSVTEQSEPDDPVVPEMPTTGPVALTFESTEVYTVDRHAEAAESVTVTYTDAEVGGKYKNISANVDPKAAGKDNFSVKIKNNGATATNVRIDLIGTKSVGNTDVTNIAHTATGGSDAGMTDTVYGGTAISVGANETVVVVIAYSNNSERGKVQRVQFYFDSSTYNDETVTYSGNITLSEFRFAGGLQAPQTPVDPDPPVVDPDPETPDAFVAPATGWEKIVTEENKLDGWENYTLEEKIPYAYFNGTRLINKHTPIAQNDCCGMVLKKSYSYVKCYVKNELSEAAEVRFDFVKKIRPEGASEDSFETCPVVGIMKNGEAIAVDESKCALFTLRAYEVAEIVIKLDATKGMNQLTVFLNSLKETNPSSGRIIISDFVGVVNTDLSEAEAPVSIPTEGWTDIDTAAFGGWDMYTVNTDDGINIKHETARANYNCCGMDLGVNYSYVKFTVTNNGTGEAKLRFDFKNKNLQDSAPGYVEAGYPVDRVSVLRQSNGAGVILAPGESLDVVLKLQSVLFNQMVVFLDSIVDGDNPESGDITITDLKGIVDDSIKHVDPNESKALGFEATEGKYSIDKSDNDKTVTFTYNNIDSKSYYNVKADLEQYKNEGGAITLTFKNNGSADCFIRVALTPDGLDKDNKADNLGDNTQQVYVTDNKVNVQQNYDGKNGRYFTLVAGDTVTIKFVYSKDSVKKLVMYFDSSYNAGGTNYSGNITVSNILISAS